jgi:membrane fusion protein, copper/silver efflux system
MNQKLSSYIPEGKRTRIIILLILAITALLLGYFISRDSTTNVGGTAQHDDAGSTQIQQNVSGKQQKHSLRPQWWTCSMHPQIKLPKPGKCPICYMDLIPLDSEKGDVSANSVLQYSMSAQAKKLAEVETAEVRRQRAKIDVRMLGMVYEDETRVAAVTARVDGRLDEIYVNFTGVQVTKGDPLVTIWSPTLIKSQVELFETIRADEAEESVIKGAEEKLIQLGMTKDQIREIEQKKKPDLYVTLKAPISGTVMKKFAVLGQFVKEGTEMYTINDLSQVWIKFDAYETDIPWIRYGQDVTFTTASLPGRKFTGKVLFIDPVVDTKTRSVKVRVEAANPDLNLKPGMFVTADLESEIDQSGRVIRSEWAGKYICPVHPSDEASSVPGTCPDSKMALRPASAYGYTDDKAPVLPLVIPASAPLITGKRALVYVGVPDRDRPTYEAREVVLGPRAGDKYVVFDGLKEGERVVTRGTFKIDSAMQILSNPSMMSPSEKRATEKTEEKLEKEIVRKLVVPREFLEGLTPIINEYLEIKQALVNDDSDAAGKHVARIDELMKALNPSLPDAQARAAWDHLSHSIMNNLDGMSKTTDIDELRKSFDPLSEAFVRLLMSFRHVMKEPLVVFHCPMAFDQQGAYWVQVGEERLNPYFGRKPFKGQDMLTCGELVETIPPERFAAQSTLGTTDSATISGAVPGSEQHDHKLKDDLDDNGGRK